MSADWDATRGEAMISSLIKAPRVSKLLSKVPSVLSDLQALQARARDFSSSSQFADAVRDIFVGVIQANLDDTQRDAVANRRFAMAALDELAAMTSITAAVSESSNKMDAKAKGACRSTLGEILAKLSQETDHVEIAQRFIDAKQAHWLGSLVKDIEFDRFRDTEEFAQALRALLDEISRDAGERSSQALVDRLNRDVLNKSALIKPVLELGSASAPLKEEEDAPAEETEKDVITKDVKTSLLKALVNVRRSAIAHDFLHPVDWKKYGLLDYPKVISEPMDLGTLKTKLERGHITSLREFKRLGHVIFDNCLRYNHHDNPVENSLRKHANECRALFDQQVAACLDSVKPTAPQPSSTTMERKVKKASSPEKDAEETIAPSKKKSKRAPSPPPAVAAAVTNPEVVAAADVRVEPGEEEDEFKPPQEEIALVGSLETSFRDAVRELMNQDFAQFFNVPVDLKLYVDYKKLCPKPMDLGTVFKRLDHANTGKKPYKRVADLCNDVALIWANCRAFNPVEYSDLPILTHAKRCEAFFWRRARGIVNKHLDKMKAIRAANIKVSKSGTAASTAAAAAAGAAGGDGSKATTLLPPILPASCRDAATLQFKTPNKSEFTLTPMEERIRQSLTLLASIDMAKKHFGLPVLELYDAQFGAAYRQAIARPMDLQTCFIKLSNHEYFDETKGPQLVNEDVELIFANAKQFNADNAEILAVAEHCARFWRDIYCNAFGTKEEAQAAAERRNAFLFPMEANKKRYASVLKKLMSKEMAKTDAKEFMHPVYFDSFTLPDYPEIVKERRDLTSIAKRVDMDAYETYGEFVRDVRLVFSNALLYNRAEVKENAPIRESAQRMSELFESEWNKQSVLIYEYVLRTQEEERAERARLGDAYVEAVKKPRKSLLNAATSTAVDSHRSSAHRLPESEEDDLKDEDDEEEVKFRKKKSLGGKRLSMVSPEPLDAAAAAVGDGQQQQQRRKKQRQSVPAGGEHMLEDAAVVEGAAAAVAAAAAQQGGSANSADLTQLGQFEHETEIQVQARREVLRQRRAKFKEDKTTYRRLQRETYPAVVRNVREIALARAKEGLLTQEPALAAPSTSTPAAAPVAAAAMEVEEAAAEPVEEALLPPSTRPFLFQHDLDAMALEAAKLKQQRQHQQPVPAKELITTLDVDYLPARPFRAVLQSERFGALVLWTVLLLSPLERDAAATASSTLSLRIVTPRPLDFIPNVFARHELALAEAVRASHCPVWAPPARFHICSQRVLDNTPAAPARFHLITRAESRVEI